jgi:hypothetical protein
MCPLIDLRHLHWHALIAFAHGIHVFNSTGRDNAVWKWYPSLQQAQIYWLHCLQLRYLYDGVTKPLHGSMASLAVIDYGKIA